MKRIRPTENPCQAVEAVRWRAYRHNLLDLWALAYSRYTEGLTPENSWYGWNRYFAHRFGQRAERINQAGWEYWRWGWRGGFWAQVVESPGFGAASGNARSVDE